MAKFKDKIARAMISKSNTEISTVKADYENIAIDIAKFKKESEIDWGLAINRAIEYFLSHHTEYGKLSLPQGVINIYTDIMDIPIPIMIEGKGSFLESITPGTFINDLRPDSSTKPLFTFKNTTNTHITGHLLKNFTINGNYKVRDCINAYKCGWDFHMENVLIKRYKGAALRTDYLDDSNFIGLFIVESGSDGDVVDPIYAIECDHTTNALHFFGLHMEHCRFFMRLQDTFFVDFSGSKWEMSSLKMGTNLTHPPIYLGNCREVTFGTGCGFIPVGIKSYLAANPNMDYNLLPYFIGGSATESGNLDREVVKFVGCTGTVGLGSGGAFAFAVDHYLLMNLPKRVILVANDFNNLAGVLPPIRIGADGKPGVIMGNEFSIKDHDTTINQQITNATDLSGYSKGIRSDNCIVDGNIVWHMSSGAVTKTSYAFDGVLNRYGINETWNFVYKYNGTTTNEITERTNTYTLPEGCKSEYHFDDELTSQVIKDYSYFKKHGQLGSTTGSDANDPTWDTATGGLKFVKASSQYAKLPLGIDVTQDFTVYLFADIPTAIPASNSDYWSIGNSGTAGPSIKVYRDSTGQLVANWSNDSDVGGTNSVITAANVKTGYRLIKFTKTGTTINIKQIHTEFLNSSGNTVGSNGTIPTGTTTVNQIGLGCKLKNTASDFIDTTICFFATYQKLCTGTEDVQVLRYCKRMMGERGVSI